MTKNSADLWALHAPLAAELLAKLGNQAQTYVPGEHYASQGGVAVITVDGLILRGTQERTREGLDSALADGSVNAILLSFDSPGGLVAGTKELADFIGQAAKQKPIAAYADGLCASAAYWLAASTGRIFAPATAQVGSIGVIAVHTSWQKALEDSGIKRTLIYSGKHKAAGSPDKDLSEEDLARFQKQIAAIHAIFKADIAAHMKPRGEDWGEGQTFLAAEAKELGLVSRVVADQAEAIERLATFADKKERKMDLAQLKAEHPQLLAEYKTEIEAEWQAAMDKAAADADIMAIVKAVSGPEEADKVEKLLAAKITPAQLAAIGEIFPSVKQGAKQEAKAEAATPRASSEAAARERMLAAIESGAGAPLPADAPRANASRLLADAERRARRD